ncbi:diphthine--ammonia ligase [Thalassobacillus sp. CUG 92003]|uniref:Dph6-related ATP pyrophosphatase n=1 Tax=Thalassobacillus sp. CUG 92003 TaxID=2736641 RepID=UPI0015E74546|nr:diphthine--ammonia ligase [Thalassobacillus sp. CUG 92003]
MKVWMSFSGGKDSMLALHTVLQDDRYEVTRLFTTLNEEDKRVPMQGVREKVLYAQAHQIGLPLEKLYMPSPCPNETYEKLMGEAMAKATQQGVEAIVFGDIYLEDIRTYREENMHQVGMSAIFPLWKQNTTQLMDTFLASGYQTVICTVDTHVLPSSWLGKELTSSLLESLPEGVDVCGENGEFHTIVHNGPAFNQPISLAAGEVVQNGAFATIDLRYEQNRRS